MCSYIITTINISPGLQYFCQNTIKSTTHPGWSLRPLLSLIIYSSIIILSGLLGSHVLLTELTKRPSEVSFET